MGTQPQDLPLRGPTGKCSSSRLSPPGSDLVRPLSHIPPHTNKVLLYGCVSVCNAYPVMLIRFNRPTPSSHANGPVIRQTSCKPKLSYLH